MRIFGHVISKGIIKIPSIASGLIILAAVSFMVVPEAIVQSSNVIEVSLAVPYPILDAILVALR